MHQDYEPLVALGGRLRFPFFCNLCHASITEMMGYLQHFADRHPSEFAEIQKISGLIPDERTPFTIPNTITPFIWSNNSINSPSSRFYNFGGIVRSVTVLKPRSTSLESDLSGLCSRHSNVFVKPVVSEQPGDFAGPAPLNMLMIGSDGGLIVVDLFSGDNQPTPDFFANRNVLLHATPEEKQSLNASNIQFIPNVPSSKLGGMAFLNECDDILRELRPLNSLMNLKVDPVRKFPTSLTSFLSAISYEILLLLYLERTGFIKPRQEASTPVNSSEPPARCEVVHISREIELQLTKRRTESLYPDQSCTVENPIIPVPHCPSYRCPVCPETFPEEIQLYQHLYHSHAALDHMKQPSSEKRSFACHECSQKWSTWSDFVGHFYFRHRRQLLEKIRLFASTRGVLTSDLNQWIQSQFQKIEQLPKREVVRQKVLDPEQCSQIVQFFRKFQPHKIQIPEGANPDDLF
jgi:hypothetical protein